MIAAAMATTAPMRTTMSRPLVSVVSIGSGAGGGTGVGAGVGLTTSETTTWTAVLGLPFVMTGTPAAFCQVWPLSSPTSAWTM
jgi:hypothetical protein